MDAVGAVTRTARIAVAAFAATSGGVLTSAAVPGLLFGMPLRAMLNPTLALVMAFSLVVVITLAVPVFLLAGRRGRLGLDDYLLYSVATAATISLSLAFAFDHTISGAKIYDSLWILLTEAIPGGIVAGAVAFGVMRIGERRDASAEETAVPS